MKTRILSREDAIAFVQNMRWFADIGTVRTRKLLDGKYAVTASACAWSYWAS